MKKLGTILLIVWSAMALAVAQAPATANVLGEWDITTVSPIGENTNTLFISQEGDQLKAMARGPQGQTQGERPYDSIALTGNSITLVLTVDFQGSPMVITYTGTVDGDKVMNGGADFGGLAQGSWSAARKPEAPK